MTLHPRLDDLLELRHQAQTLGLASHHLVNSAFSGLYASVFRGSGLDFEEVREYREGDDIRNMEWHVTARTGVPHLKVFREERERSVMLCVDNGPHMNFGTHGTFKSIQAARAAALLGWAASTQHDRVGGLLYGHPEQALRYYRPGRARRELWRLLRTLTEPAPEGGIEGDPLLMALQRLDRSTVTGGLIFVIGSFDRNVASLEQGLGSLRQRHTIVLLPIDDPADREIPPMGRVVFSGPDGELLEIDTDDPEGRELFSLGWDGRRKELLSICHRLGVSVIPLRTDDEIHGALMVGLRRHAQNRVIR